MSADGGLEWHDGRPRRMGPGPRCRGGAAVVCDVGDLDRRTVPHRVSVQRSRTSPGQSLTAGPSPNAPPGGGGGGASHKCIWEFLKSLK